MELTLKERSRIAQKLRDYAASHYATITYRCKTPGIARAVSAAAARAGIADRVRCEPIDQQAAMPRGSALVDIEPLLTHVRNEQERAAAAERASDEAAQLARQQSAAGMTLIDDIALYLRADRSQQRAIRERWQHLVERRESAHRHSP